MWILKGITIKGFLLASVLTILIVALSFVSYILWESKSRIKDEFDQSISNNKQVIKSSLRDVEIIEKNFKDQYKIDEAFRGDNREINFIID